MPPGIRHVMEILHLFLAHAACRRIFDKVLRRLRSLKAGDKALAVEILDQA